MSYEGHEKILCENGHLTIQYAYTEQEQPWRCPYCRARSAATFIVDETNGPDETGLCPGDVKLKVRRAHRCRCMECGNQHRSEPVQYHIPKG